MTNMEALNSPMSSLNQVQLLLARKGWLGLFVC